MRSSLVALLCSLLLLTAAPDRVLSDEDPGAGDAAPTLSPREVSWHVLNRLAFGPKPGEIEALAAEGWKQWAEAQLEPASVEDDACDALVAQRFPSLGMNLTETWKVYWPQPPVGFDQLSEEIRNKFLQERNELYYRVQMELRHSVLTRAAFSRRQLQEVMVEFWRNHFNVDQTKGFCRLFSNHYEEQVIRKHAFGKFEDMLLAVARHPAMLIYLDNEVSQKPLTKEEKKQLDLIRKARVRDPNAQLGSYAANLIRQTGLNENFARELMELHTLGVDRGYTQTDVYEVARTLTGWTHGWEDEPYTSDYGFVFRGDVHDDNPKRVLGKKLTGQSGEKEGQNVIRMLARHKITAEFIAMKLCRYLVNDNPPRKLVDRVARKFRESNGHLPEVYREIIFSPEFLAHVHYRAKFKSPFEFVVSALRATDAAVEDPNPILYRLHRMGQPIYQCDDPTGYFDNTDDWLDPGVLVHRWDFALSLMLGYVKGTTVSEEFIGSLEKLPPQEARNQILASLAPSGVDERTRKIFDRAFGLRRWIGLVLGSPSFQKQ